MKRITFLFTCGFACLILFARVVSAQPSGSCKSNFPTPPYLNTADPDTSTSIEAIKASVISKATRLIPPYASLTITYFEYILEGSKESKMDLVEGHVVGDTLKERDIRWFKMIGPGVTITIRCIHATNRQGRTLILAPKLYQSIE